MNLRRHRKGADLLPVLGSAVLVLLVVVVLSFIFGGTVKKFTSATSGKCAERGGDHVVAGNCNENGYCTCPDDKPIKGYAEEYELSAPLSPLVGPPSPNLKTSICCLPVGAS